MTASDFVRTVRNSVQSIRSNRFVPAGHFYSPLPSDEDVARALKGMGPGSEIDLRVDHQVALGTRLREHVTTFDDTGRYEAVNPQFPWPDAAVYRAMLTEFRPKRVVEVGSGHSSALALDTADLEELPTEFTFVDPYPQRLLSVLRDSDRDRVRIRQQPVQVVERAVFDEIGAGDFLFIDSTHVAKAGSDVLHLYLTVLPSIAQGVWVHIHDIFWPFEYPREWFEQGRAWNEIYFLRAFLAMNDEFQVEFFSDHLAQTKPAAFAPFAGPNGDVRPSSIWLRRV